MIRMAFLAFLLVSVGSTRLPGQDKSNTHPFSVHDMLAMDRISDPQASPDGKQVVFVLRKTDLEANRGRTDLWIVNADGSGLRQLTTDPANDSSPRWSPDGKSIFFLSTRSGSSQVWQLPLQGGEALQVTNAPLDLENLIISRDGKYLGFTARMFPDCETMQCTRDKLDKIADQKSSGRIYTQLFIRHWDTWEDGRWSHLFVMDLDNSKTVDVMKGMTANTPSQPFGGPEEFSFTPDSKSIVFTAKNMGREDAWTTNFDLFLVPVDGSASPVNLTEKNKAWDTTPVFSPDGRTMAYLAMSRPGFEADRFRIILRSWPDGAERVLADNWDRSPGTIFWSPDGKTLFAAADNLGQHSLFAIDIKHGGVNVVVQSGTVNSPQMIGKRVLYGKDDLKSPVELYTCNPNGSDFKQITNINAAKVAAASMGDYEQFTFKGWNDETVYGYIVKPANFDPSKKYPVAFLIHGGPQGSFGNHFHYRWNPQAYAGAGYAAVMVDFHGSTGYGQAFQDAIRGDWGGKPLVDLQKGLAAALQRNPWMDGDRVGALGASYGGYMINWIAGNWPDRFKCLVSHDGNLDERAAYFDTEELWFPEWEHEGTPWTNPEGYEKQNPVNFVKNWKTPMLIIHGGRDYRVVDTQGISSFTALQRLGIPSRFLYFPDENHWVLKPANSILWHDTVIGWLDQWLKK